MLSLNDLPYTIIIERNTCKSCGRGLLWTVQGPDDYGGIGLSYEKESDARAEVFALNHAYELGYQAGRVEG